jgi:hypothetical protein
LGGFFGAKHPRCRKLGCFSAREDYATPARHRLRPARLAVVNALVLAEVMHVTEDLDLGSRLQPRPLIYPT